MRRVGLAALLVAFTLAGGTPAQEDKTKKKPSPADLVGKPAPDFTADFALNGEKMSLAGLKGKVVLVDFWAVWCPPCKAAFPSLTKLHENYNKKGLEIVGLTRYYERYEGFKDGKLVTVKEKGKKVSNQVEQEMLGTFVKHFKLPYRIQTVPPSDFTKYHVSGIPTAVLIDRKGTVRSVKVGFSEAGMKALEEKIKELLEEKS
jgi:thiol-disulfide isomerase/thioredoxin